MYLHEQGHDMETDERGTRTGLDVLVTGEENVNPYRKEKRKYERRNETLRDIRALQVDQILRQMGITFLEPREFTYSDETLYNENTDGTVKDLLVPFEERYKDELSDALIDGNMVPLFAKIGEENYEELNDVVNKVDSLISVPFLQALKENDEKISDVQEYKIQLKRLEEIYRRMELHSSKHKTPPELVKGAVRETKHSVRGSGIAAASSLFEKER